MGDAEDCGSIELFVDELLSSLLSNNVDVCSCLVKNDDLVVAENGSNDADKLAFTNTEVFAFFLNFEVQSLVIIFFLFSLIFFIFCLVILFGLFVFDRAGISIRGFISLLCLNFLFELFFFELLL